MRKWVIVAATALLLVAINVVIAGRESLLVSGRIVLLELAPVDPRSFMQGDFMALRFRVADGALTGSNATQQSDGRLVLAVDARGVATFRRLDDGAPPANDEVLLRFRIRNGRPQLATNAFFFEEGTGDAYAQARYGEFRVAGNGDAILTGMRNAELAPLGTTARQ